jgi:putative flippase GtrA
MRARESTGIAPAGFRIGSVVAFGLVGAAAALVHFLVVILLVPLGTHPLVGNVVAFITAFGISFFGHGQWSFPARRARPRALPRFLTVAASSFVANELLYALLLWFTPLGYRAALVIVLILVASATFMASKHWAFR